MNRVGLVRTEGSYRGLVPPFAPGVVYPELSRLAALAGAGFETAGERNHVYAAVREALRALDLDREHFGGEAWNPLGDFVRPGATIVLKPNFIRHWNPREEQGAAGATVESVITHGSVLRAVAAYAMLAAGPEGEVIVAEAPQQDCDFERIRALAGLDELVAHGAACGHELSVIDLRREAVVFDGGIIVERRSLPMVPIEPRRSFRQAAAAFWHAHGLGGPEGSPCLRGEGQADPGASTRSAPSGLPIFEPPMASRGPDRAIRGDYSPPLIVTFPA